MSDSEKKQGVECPNCGCRHFYVLLTLRRAQSVICVRRSRHCSRLLVSHERVIRRPADENIP